MNLKLIIARGKLFSAEDKLDYAKHKLLKANDTLRFDTLKVKKAQENYDKAFKIWFDIGVSKKEGSER
jgi:hypothetical protein